jgi:hypothetical protein
MLLLATLMLAQATAGAGVVQPSSQGREASSSIIRLKAPPRVCTTVSIDQDVAALVDKRPESEIKSIRTGAQSLISYIREAVEPSLHMAGISLRDGKDGPTVTGYLSKSDALTFCRSLVHAAYVDVHVHATAAGKPYGLTASIMQDGSALSVRFERDGALDDLERYYGAVLPEQPNVPYLRPAIGWSVDNDVLILMRSLMDRVVWIDPALTTPPRSDPFSR